MHILYNNNNNPIPLENVGSFGAAQADKVGSFVTVQAKQMAGEPNMGVLPGPIPSNYFIFKFEPPHDKTNKMSVRPVFAVRDQCAAKDT